jgi:hypothetical protein
VSCHPLISDKVVLDEKSESKRGDEKLSFHDRIIKSCQHVKDETSAFAHTQNLMAKTREKQLSDFVNGEQKIFVTKFCINTF